MFEKPWNRFSGLQGKWKGVKPIKVLNRNNASYTFLEGGRGEMVVYITTHPGYKISKTRLSHGYNIVTPSFMNAALCLNWIQFFAVRKDSLRRLTVKSEGVIHLFLILENNILINSVHMEMIP